MMLRTVSFRIDTVAGGSFEHLVSTRQTVGQLRKRLDAIVAAGRPPLLEQHDEARRPRVEAADELGAQGAHDRRLDVVKEVEVIEEARRLPDAQPEQRMRAAVARV